MNISRSLAEAAGGIRIPSYLAGRMITSRGWSFRFFPLSKTCKHLGLLFERLQPSKPGLADYALWIYGVILGLAWLIVATRFLQTGELPSPHVRENLLLWFFSVIAIPLLLGISAGGNLLADRRSNLMAALEQDMVASLEAIDAESGGIIQNQKRRILDLLSRPSLVNELRAAQLDKQPTKPILDRIWREGCDLGLRMRALTIIGHGSFIQSRIETEFSKKVNAVILGILSNSLGSVLASEPDPNVLFPTITESKAKSSLMVLMERLGIDSPQNTSLDNIERLWFGWTSFSTRLWLDKKVWYIVNILWNQDLAFSTFLTDRIGGDNRKDGVCQIDSHEHEDEIHSTKNSMVELGAFHLGIDGLELVACSKNDSRSGATSLRLIAERGKSERTSLTQIIGSETWLTLAFPSKRMPDFILAARVSLSPVFVDLHWETVMLVLMLIAAIALVLIVAFLLSEFLAAPIVRMSQGLKLIAAGNLDITVAEDRRDELGEAGIALDKMTRSLRERRKISRFVAPQVLELVAGGDLERAAGGRISEVTVLASDMRNFTTISESHPPREVFSTLNRHLTAMTQAIQAHGGAIDRFIGDAVVAVFYPGGLLPSTVRALSAARAMMSAHANLQLRRKASGEFQYSIGVGIETGRVVTGVMGDEETRLDFTVVGEPASHAAELENLSKRGKASRIVVSQTVRNSIDVWNHDDSLNPLHHMFLPLEGVPGVWELDGSPPPEITDNDIDHHDFIAPEIIHDMTAANHHGYSDNSSQKTPITGMPTTSAQDNRGEEAVVPSDSGGNLSEDEAHKNNPRRHYSSVLLFLLWFLPLILIGTAISALRRSHLETELRRAQTLLQQDASWIGKTIDPRLQTTLFLREQIGNTLRRFPRNYSIQEARTWLPKRLAATFRKIESDLPGIFWAWCGYPLFPVNSSQEREFVPDERLCVTGGKPAPIDRSMLFTLSKAIYWKNVWSLTSFEDLPDVKRDSLGSEMSKLFQSPRSFDVLRQAMIVLHPTTLNKTQTTFFCYPLSTHDLRGQNENLFTGMKKETALLKIPTRPRNSPTFFRRQFYGNLLIFIDPSSITPRRSINFITKYLKTRGTQLSLVTPASKVETNSNITAPDSSGSSVLSICTAMQKYIHSAMSSSLHTVQSSSTLFHSVRLGNQIFQIKLSRLIPESFMSRHLITAFAIAAILWTLFCVRILLQHRFDIKLHWLLTSAFLLAVIPSLFPAILILERSRHESDLRLVMDERARMESAARTFDDAREFGNSWLFALFDEFSRHPDFINSLRSSSDPLTRQKDDKRKSDALTRLVNRVVPTGIQPDSANFFDNSGFFAQWPTAKAENQKNSEMFGRLVTFLFKSNLQTHSNLSDRDELLLNAEFEEIRNIIPLLIGSIGYARMFMSQIYIGEWLIGGAQRPFFFRKSILSGGKPCFGLCLMFREPFDLYQFHSWLTIDPTWGLSNLDFGIVNRFYPGAFLFSPFMFFSEFNYSLYQGELQARISSPLHRLTTVAAESLEPVVETFDTGDSARMTMVYPAKSSDKWLFIVESPIGHLLSESRKSFDRSRLLLLAILASVLLLSRRVATRFISPALELARAAQCVTEGNFEVCLPIDRTDEFGILANAFNDMTKEAKSGRLLGRFVSGAVRAVARDDSRERAAQEGESLEAVILFAGLADFKHMIQTAEPVALVKSLNSHLESMSRLVRDHGGEIDKFIGDKILAVFYPAEGTGVTKAILKAVAAAQAMREYATTASELPCPLCVGITAGPVLAGILGTEAVRLELTVIGDTVNLASRLSDLAATLPGGGMIVDGHIAETLMQTWRDSSEKQPHIERMTTTRVKGKTREIEIFLVW
ncbi:MAG: HAMP domain-containing protein [Candidatus Riflebacteria bacterium]|nr:HAMP domain-containing protein [Candidatus Riflebacteria bacterium]